MWLRGLILGLLMVITDGGSAADLIAALSVPVSGLTITSLTILGNNYTGAGGQITHTASGNGHSYGSYTNASNVYGIGSGIVISTGKAKDYGDGSPGGPTQLGTKFNTTATAGQIALLTPIGSGPGPWNDVTEIDVSYQLDSQHDTVQFDVVFGSNEYPNYQGYGTTDSFGLYVNGVNIAYAGIPVVSGSWAGGTASLNIGLNTNYIGQDVGNLAPLVIQVVQAVPAGYATLSSLVTSAAGTSIGYAVAANPGPFVSGVLGFPTQIDHPYFATISGTRLNGVLNPPAGTKLRFQTKVGLGSSGSLIFIIADMIDWFYDSTAYISGLAGVAVPASGGSVVNAAGLRRPCAPLQTINRMEWSNLQRIIDAVRPEPLEETKWRKG